MSNLLEYDQLPSELLRQALIWEGLVSPSLTKKTKLPSRAHYQSLVEAGYTIPVITMGAMLPLPIQISRADLIPDTHSMWNTVIPGFTQGIQSGTKIAPINSHELKVNSHPKLRFMKLTSDYSRSSDDQMNELTRDLPYSIDQMRTRTDGFPAQLADVIALLITHPTLIDELVLQGNGVACLLAIGSTYKATGIETVLRVAITDRNQRALDLYPARNNMNHDNNHHSVFLR